MDQTERNKLIDFCVEATAELNGVEKDVVNRMEFVAMDDKELNREADWLSDMLDK